MLLFSIQSTRNWTEITWGNVWQCHTRHQIRQSHWISDHWTWTPTVSNARSWETLSWQAEQRLGPLKFVAFDLPITCKERPEGCFFTKFCCYLWTDSVIPFHLTNLNRIDQEISKLLVRNRKPSQQDVTSLCTWRMCVHLVQYTQLYLWFLNFLPELYVENGWVYVKDNTAGFSTPGCIARVFILCLAINLLGLLAISCKYPHLLGDLPGF